MAETKKMGRPSNGKPVILRIPATEETRNALDAAAKAQRRSMAAYAGAVIEAALGTATPAPLDETPKRQKTSNGPTVMLNISLQPDLKDAVKAIAKMEHRTASNMASLMLRDWIEQWEAKHPGVNVWPAVEE